MMDPQKFQDEAATIVLHAWVAFYLGSSVATATDLGPLSTRLASQAAKLQESAAHLSSALEKMRAANAKLALRMAEHKAFFAKYQAPE